MDIGSFENYEYRNTCPAIDNSHKTVSLNSLMNSSGIKKKSHKVCSHGTCSNQLISKWHREVLGENVFQMFWDCMTSESTVGQHSGRRCSWETVENSLQAFPTGLLPFLNGQIWFWPFPILQWFTDGVFWQEDPWASLKRKPKDAHASAWEEEAILNVLGVLSPFVIYEHNVYSE